MGNDIEGEGIVMGRHDFLLFISWEAGWMMRMKQGSLTGKVNGEEREVRGER